MRKNTNRWALLTIIALVVVSLSVFSGCKPQANGNGNGSPEAKYPMEVSDSIGSCLLYTSRCV